MTADPRHRPRGIDAREHGQAAEHGAGPTDPAVTGHLDQFAGLGPAVEVGDGREDLRLVDRQPEVLPTDEDERAR